VELISPPQRPIPLIGQDLDCYSKRWETSGATGADTSQIANDLEIPSCWTRPHNLRSDEDWKDLAEYFTNKLPNPEESTSTGSLLSKDHIVEWMNVIQWWSQQRSEEGIFLSINAFDRLVRDCHYYQSNVISNALDESNCENFGQIVHDLLVNWHEKIKREPDSTQETLDPTNVSRLFSPTGAFQHLREWRHQGIPIQKQTYTRLMQASVQLAESPSDRSNVPMLCENIVALMLENPNKPNQSEGTTTVRPDMEDFIFILKAWAKSGRKDRVRCGMGTIQIIQDYFAKGIVDQPPNIYVYNALLELLSSGTVDDMLSAEQVFQQLERGMISGIHPDKVSYRIIFYGLVNIIDEYPRARRRAIALLKQMETDEEQFQINGSLGNSDSPAQLDSSMYAYLILKLTHAGKYEDAEEVYLRFLKMQVKSPTPRFVASHHIKRSMIALYASTGRPQEAEQLVLEMEHTYGANQLDDRKPRRSHYEAVLESWAISDHQQAEEKTKTWMTHIETLVLEKGRQDLVPRQRFVTLLLELVGSSPKPRPGGAFRADTLFRDFLKMENSVKSEKRLVNHDAYGRLMNIWAKSGEKEGPKRTEGLLLEMQSRAKNGEHQLRPRVAHYTSVVLAWTSSRQPKAIDRAEGIFDYVHGQSRKGNKEIALDATMYGTMINAFARTKNVDKMERIALLMIEDFRSGNKSAKPGTRVLNTMILGVLKSKRPSLKRSQYFVELFGQVNVKGNKRTAALLGEISTMTS